MRKQRKKYEAKEYHNLIIDFALEHDRCAIWASMGTGKTGSILTVIDRQLMMGFDKPKLVIAPLLVAKTTWEDEAMKWEHTKGIRVVPIIGNELERRRAMATKAEVYTTNYEQIPWLVEYYGDRWPYEDVIADESTKLKNYRTRQGGQRAQALAKVVHSKVRRFIELTGTPAPNGLKDLWGQIWMLDAGKRLGRTYQAFVDRWFKIPGYGDNKTPQPLEHSEREIHAALKDICLTINAADWVDLKEPIVVNKYVPLPPRARELYQKMEDEFFFELEGHEIEAANAAVKSGKLLQICNGAAYIDPDTESDDDPRATRFKEIHDAKIQALESIVNEACGMPVLVAVNFKSDAVRLTKAFPKGKVLTSANGHLLMPLWNEGKIPLMFTHPACLHGDVEVLTEHRGWRKLTDVQHSDRVFDGEEYVNHDGCQYSGHKEVIDCFGILMTPNHKLLISGEWREANDVRDSEVARREACYEYKGNDSGLSEMFKLRGAEQNTFAEPTEEQSIEEGSLRSVYKRHFPQYDENLVLEHLERFEVQGERQIRQGLRRTRDNYMRLVVKVLKFLQRYVPKLRRGANHRTHRRNRGVFERELHLGINVQATSEQANNKTAYVSRFFDPLSRISQANRFESLHINDTTEPRYERRSSGSIGEEFEISKEKAHVYDLVNCGPRNRFVVRNECGEVFISHNSAGHGLNLQDGGNILVFFGLGWNLEHRLQVIERIGPMRQLQAGYDRPVFIYNIVAKGTIDELVLERMDGKKSVQDILLNAMARRKRR